MKLPNVAPSLRRLPSETRLFRIYRRGGLYPTHWNDLRHFGPIDARFDHHEAGAQDQPFTQSRGIIYCAEDVVTCLAEVYKDRFVDPSHEHPWLVAFELVRPVRLLDLTDTFLLRIGMSMEVLSGPRSRTRALSKELYEAYPSIEGLYYQSSRTNRPTVALFERVLRNSPFPLTPEFHHALSDPQMLDPLHEACTEIGYELVV